MASQLGGPSWEVWAYHSAGGWRRVVDDDGKGREEQYFASRDEAVAAAGAIADQVDAAERVIVIERRVVADLNGAAKRFPPRAAPSAADKDLGSAAT